MKDYVKSILTGHMDDDMADILSSEIVNDTFKDFIVESATRLAEAILKAVKDEAKLCEGKPDD